MIVMGVDGGGSKTAVRIAEVDAKGETRTLGEGCAGPSNVRAVGLPGAMHNLQQAIRQALAQPGSDALTIDVAVLALAGSSRADVRDQVTAWATEHSLASLIRVVPDTESVLVLATKDDIGVALIVGTGSVATGVGPGGEHVLTGGWGYWYGDQGSGYDLGRRALQAVTNAVDRLGEDTALVESIQSELGISEPRDILGVLTSAEDVRREIARLAPLLIEAAASGDIVAEKIVRRGAQESSNLVRGTAQKLGLGNCFPLGIAGGVACNSDYYQRALLRALATYGIAGEPLAIITEPVEGAVRLACQHALAQH